MHDAVVELAQVARLGVARERLHTVLVHGADLAADGVAGTPEEVLLEQGDVLEALAQRWDPQHLDGEAVVQVGVEDAGTHGLLQVAVGGGEDALFTSRGTVEPTGCTTCWSSTRRGAAWAREESSATSSRNTVPPSATSKRPTRFWSTPVKAPFSQAKSSASSRDSATAPQF